MMIDSIAIQAKSKITLQSEKVKLYSVWIDQDCGCELIPDWAENSYPKSIQEALKESREANNLHFPTVITLEGCVPQ